MKKIQFMLFLWAFFAISAFGQESEAKHLNFTSAYEGDTQITSPYETSVLQDNGVSFDFYVPISFTENFHLTITDGSSTETYTSSNNPCKIKNGALMRLFVPLSLQYNHTYDITLSAGSLCAKDDVTMLNEEVTFRVISSTNDAEIKLTTPYETEAAPIISRIILSASSNIESINHKSYTATLVGKKDNEEEDRYEGLIGLPNINQLVFTPTDIRPLKPGYAYTLTLDGEGAEINDNKDAYFPQKEFSFSTQVPEGNKPVLISTSPAAESTIAYNDVQPASATQITATFDEEIKLVDGATVTCIPVGGSEGIHVKYFTNESIDNTLYSDGKNLYFNYSGDNLHYGLRYEVTIPTYAITGQGGMPLDEDLHFYFYTGKHSNASDTRDRKDVYTWDFTNISEDSWSKLEESATANNSFWGKGTVNNRSAYGSFGASKSDKRRFNQNQEIRFGDGNVMKELRGILFTLVNNRSNRFCICTTTESETSYIDMTGGTHYMTLQDVPTGATVFIEYTDQFFNLNSTNADSLRTYTNSLRHNVSLYKVNKTGDINFCFQNLKLYRIAIVKDYKSIGNNEKQFKYSTYSQLYPVDFKQNDNLSDKGNVTAYKISDTYTSDATYVNFTEMPDNLLAAEDGAILTATKFGEKSSHPIFAADINTIPEKQDDNALVATNNGIKFTEAENGQNYILTYQYFNIYDENKAIVEGDQQCFYKWVGDDIGKNLAYLHLENPYNTTAKAVIYLDWYKTVPTHIGPLPNRDYNRISNGICYTLDGKKCSSATGKGIYIQQGKKFIIK